MHVRILLLIVLLTCGSLAKAEKVSYEIYAMNGAELPTLIAKGVKEYRPADIHVEENNDRGRINWSKSLELDGGFTIGASIYREPEVTGFGLWAQRSPCGFSWEWFNATDPGHFKKLQEIGQLSVSYRNEGELKEIAEIVFDSDVSLRLNESQDPDRKTHRILIKKGSVLKFPLNSSLNPDLQRKAAASRRKLQAC